MIKQSHIIILILLILSACVPEQKEHEEEHKDYPIMKVHATSDILNLHEFTITFNRQQIKAGNEAVLEFGIMRGTQPAKLQISHGALMHVIVVSRDLEKFYHLHPDEHAPGTMGVEHVFEEPGEYRVWIEFITDDLEHVIDYDLTVS